MNLMGSSRSRSRFIRHGFALIASVATLAIVALAWYGISGPRSNDAGVARNFASPAIFGSSGGSVGGVLPWPWLVFGMPVLFSLPLSIVFEWFEARRLVKAWVAPFVLIPPVSVVWAFASGLEGQFEGAVSVLQSLPAGLFCAGAFTAYWLPLWVMRLLMRRNRRRANA